MLTAITWELGETWSLERGSRPESTCITSSPDDSVKVAQLCLTLGNPMDCSSPGSSVHGIPQTRILDWVAISFSRETS